MQNELPEINRQNARKQAEENSKHNDMKQHADKLIQGFQKLSDNHAKRAIWELFQNAIDLSDNAEIVIEITPDELIFKHNGKPFDDNTLNCLIKQVSSKSAENNDDEIGQYGTGFIATHSFGRKILLSGSLANQGAFIALDRFSLDRCSLTSPELIKDLIKQQDAVFDLIENGQYISTKANFTEFAYQTVSFLQKKYAEISVNNLPMILPYVMHLNKRLQKVTVIAQNKSTTIYQKGDLEIKDGLNKATIKINESENHVYSISCEDPEITIILPLNENHEAFLFDADLSKLFLYYPLIGTESFGVNYIIHSKLFYPTEQRDGIYLNSNTEQVQQNEETNRQIIEKASELIFDFIRQKADSIKNPLNLAQINFIVNSDKPLLNEYFIKLNHLWVEQFKSFPLVETISGNLTPTEAAFIDPELLNSVDAFNNIYSLISKYFKNVPKKELVSNWTRIIVEWKLDSVNFIGITSLVEKIQSQINLDNLGSKNELVTFYSYLIQQGHGEFFNRYKLLPNIKGEFRLLTQLNKNINLPNFLIEIADTIMPDVPKRHIHPEFIFSFELVTFTRKSYTTEINNQVATVIKDDTLSIKIENNYLLALTNYCKIIFSTDSSSVPSRMIKKICNFYHWNDELVQIDSDKDDELDTRPPQKRLLRLFLNDLSKKDSNWVVENSEFLKSVLEIGVNYYEYEEMFNNHALFPNQLNELTSTKYLQVDSDIPDEVKNIYDKIVRPNFPIRANLIHNDFRDFVKSKEPKTTGNLTEQIESVLDKDGQYNDIKSHPFQEEIIFILNRIMLDENWGKYFPRLNEKRAAVMLNKVSDSQITSDVFSIIKLKPEQINKLGGLARNDNMDQIIQLGISAFADMQKTEADFQFKYYIGKHIENLIKEKIGADLNRYTVEVKDEQNGKDIVILKDSNPIYFIEVKSRWDDRNSVQMSRNQFLNAIDNKENYALCAVDMTKYKVGEEGRYDVKDTSVIVNNIKFVNTIGFSLEPLISGIFLKQNIDTEITLTGDYKATIPQTIIQEGMNLDDFIKLLLVDLKLEVN